MISSAVHSPAPFPISGPTPSPDLPFERVIEQEAQTLLIITSNAEAGNCAEKLATSTGYAVQIAASRELGLIAMKRGDYAAVIMDESLLEADQAAAELLWKGCGGAVPIPVNFALHGCARLCREVKAALARREQEQALALFAVASRFQTDLRSVMSGLLLQSQLAFAEPGLPPQSAARLKLVLELAGRLRNQLEQPWLPAKA